MKNIDIKKLNYVELMSFLGEVNRPPGGKDSIRRVVQNCFISEKSKVLDVGCNTGYCSFEITHLTKSQVSGIDISPSMINTAKNYQKKDPLSRFINFKVGDATNIPFGNNYFDVVISGGSTAFMEKKKKAIKEFKRVLKPWGFLADINFYYKKVPPKKLLRKLNKLMKINILPWNESYWLNLYEKSGLEHYYLYKGNVNEVTKKEVKDYCSILINEKNLSESNKKDLIKKLTEIMNLFNLNHKYLVFGIFISRKRPIKEQISLFGK